jgi:hypothetical protein
MRSRADRSRQLRSCARGMNRVTIECQTCGREVALPIEAVADRLTLPVLGPRAVCTKCGRKGNVVRADWSSVPGYTHSVFQYGAP